MAVTIQSPENRIRFACIACHKRISTKAEYAGKRGRCPKCRHVQPIPADSAIDPDNSHHLTVDLRIFTPTVVESIHARQGQPIRIASQLINDHRFRQALKLLIYVGVPAACLVPLFLLTKGLADGSIPTYKLERSLSELVTRLMASSVLWAPVTVAALVYLLSVHKVRRLRAIIYFTIWLGIPAYSLLYAILGLVNQDVEVLFVGVMFCIFFGFPWWCYGHWPARWITPYMLALFVHRLHCPRCHNNKDLIDVWKCSCGYQDHRPRNVLLFSCPQCGQHVGMTDCPYCDASILT